MNSLVRARSFALLAALAGCDDPEPSETGDTGETETGSETGSETGDPDSACPTELPVGEFFDYAISVDGVSLDVGSEYDVERDCMVGGAADDGSLSLICPDFMFELSSSGPAAAAILDVPGASVHLRLVRVSVWNYANTWLRLDFVGADASVFMIDADELAPGSATWTNPWLLAVGQECVSEPSIDQRAQSLVLERDGQSLEVWQGESGTLGDPLEVWVDRSVRSGPDAPAGDGPSGLKELVIVSRGHLAPGELCDPGIDVCGPGLGCCYPCGDGGCEYTCGSVDPVSGECPLLP